MGTWGAGAFENDAACDFTCDVVDHDDLAVLEQAIDGVLNYPWKIQEALAAADVVARLAGRRGAHSVDILGRATTEEIDAWSKRLGLSPPKELVKKAREMIDQILKGPTSCSWEEWRHAVEELDARLAAAVDGMSDIARGSAIAERPGIKAEIAGKDTLFISPGACKLERRPGGAVGRVRLESEEECDDLVACLKTQGWGACA